MTLFLAILGWTLFGLVILIAMFLNLLGLFGNWLILGAVASAWALSGFEYFSPTCLAILAGLTILGEIAEMGATGLGAKRFGGERGSIVASIAGCLVGAIVLTPIIPIPLLGTIIGACLGAFTGAASYQYLILEKEAHEALWTGVGAALGKVAGLMAKSFIGFAMLGVALLMF